MATSNRRSLLSPKTIQAVIDNVRALGLVHMYTWKINTQAHAFHVPVTFAQVTSLFFYHPSKAFIVQLEFIEDDFWEAKHRGHWTISFYVHSKSWQMVNGEIVDFEFPKDLIPGFHYYGNGNFDGQSNDPVTDLPAAVKKLLELYEPWLHDKFDELLVTGFAPHYIFPGSERKFWESFPYRLLLPLVKGKVYGDVRKVGNKAGGR